MFAVVAALVVFLLVVEPLLVAAHEFGHAIVPVAQGRETAVFVGGDRGPTITLGTLTVTIAPTGLLSPVTRGATVTDVQTDRWSMLVGTLAGPAMSLLATIVAWRAFQIAGSDLLWWLSYVTLIYGGLQTFSTLAPFSAKVTDDGEAPFKTDGRIALELLLGRDPVLDGSKRRFQDPD
jgi:hypothetical protein